MSKTHIRSLILFSVHENVAVYDPIGQSSNSVESFERNVHFMSRNRWRRSRRASTILAGSRLRKNGLSIFGSGKDSGYY